MINILFLFLLLIYGLLLCFIGNGAITSLSAVKISKRNFSDKNEIEVSLTSDNPLTATLKRGTGGRSSFNGNVVTVFGATCPLGKVLVSNLTRRGTQVIIPYRGDPMEVRELKVSGDLGQVMFVVSFPWIKFILK